MDDLRRRPQREAEQLEIIPKIKRSTFKQIENTFGKSDPLTVQAEKIKEGFFSL